MSNAYPEFAGTVEEFVKWARSEGYPHGLGTGRQERNLANKFWDDREET